MEIVFHGLNPEDPTAKIAAFQEIVSGSQSGANLQYQMGNGGSVPGSSSSFQWVTISG